MFLFLLCLKVFYRGKIMKENKLVGINNYCLTNHTINEKINRFSIKSYKSIQKSLFCESFYLTQDKNFKYETWLLRE